MEKNRNGNGYTSYVCDWDGVGNEIVYECEPFIIVDFQSKS